MLTSAAQFLADSVLLDLEIGRDGRLWQIGAVRGAEVFERSEVKNPLQDLAALDRFCAGAAALVGHNLLGHDLPFLQTLNPALSLLRLPVADTLFLSPLAFPQNPYHRLVKDYKLVRASLNNPVADARLAAGVFQDQWQNFKLYRERQPGLLAFYRFCFSHAQAGALPADNGGLGLVFSAFAPASPKPEEAAALWLELSRNQACCTGSRPLAESILHGTWSFPALAYCLAWLQVAGGNSVLPPWVRQRFPEVVAILRELRDRPCDSLDCGYCRQAHEPEQQLDLYFRLPGFRSLPDGRPLQRQIVTHAMRDQPLLAILPTGGGKSLCYQLPAFHRFARRGLLTIVISPLQALMKDQVDNLVLKTGSNAAGAVYGMLTPPERGEVLERLRLGDLGILYISPEQLRNRSLKEAIKQREIGCWVFDEAHCLSKWGHDFRPDYLFAARFIKSFAAEQQVEPPPVACFTATAKKDVVAEILEHFRSNLGQELHFFSGSVERHNLNFEVHQVRAAEKMNRIHSLLQERLSGPAPASLAGGAIIYCATRKQSENCALYLSHQGWQAEAFHAGLAAPRKRRIQDDFIAGAIPVICATNAFGMGIDKENVRLVIHADIPGSLENYLQEAGRAGRDQQEAQCILLYDEDDIETQFKLSGMSELSRRDISQILRGLRRAERNRENEVVITTGELLRDQGVETEFDRDDPRAETKVKTAVAWLERAGFVERNLNQTRVFQGKPRVRSAEEVRARLDQLNLAPAARRQWEILLGALLNCDPDEGVSADELASLPGLFPKAAADDPDPLGVRRETETQKVLRFLHEMAAAGLIQQGIQMTAYLRPAGKNNARSVFATICALEKEMLALMQEESPEADQEQWQHMSLRHFNQRLLDLGHPSNPTILKNLLSSLSQDGRGLAGQRGSIDLRYLSQDTYVVKLQRDWQSLLNTAELRRQVAEVLLQALYRKIPARVEGGGEVLVDFSSEEMTTAIARHLFLGAKVRDPLAAVDRGLMYLHEQRAIMLQQGLAVFRQAMTIKILPESRGRRYSAGDFQPLAHHYRERVFQIHVMQEYARLALEKVSLAVALVLGYFSMERLKFIRRFFPGKGEELERAVSQESYRRIVESLANPRQEAIVAAPAEGNLLVLAGPGAGKTRVVVHRCAYLLKVLRAPARSILVLCFNHNARIALRRRLHDLVGRDSAQVVVLTYHGLAMRLTGASFAGRAEEQCRDNGAGEEAARLASVIPEALALLRGEKEVPGFGGDELREQLLAGFRYILVDEYQDIDEEQYALISRLAGRTEADPDHRIGLLAVGDDDQSIYGFRQANVRFIRRFAEDYRANIHYLVENYRSTACIIAAANLLISRNRERIKTDHAIRINAAREGQEPGGIWQRLDVVSQGRVQVLRVADVRTQAEAAASEISRLHDLDPAGKWSDFAVLARNGLRLAELAVLRAVLEERGIPVSWSLERDKALRLHRVREFARFFELLKQTPKPLLTAAELQEMVQTPPVPPDNPWQGLVLELLAVWQEESAGQATAVQEIRDFFYETLAEQQRRQRFGQGVLLSTVHGVKGMEFPHVFILDGSWQVRPEAETSEEERRLYYVGMTRAIQTLSLFSRADCDNPHLRLISGDGLCRRTPAFSLSCPEALFLRHFEILGAADLVVDFAGWQTSESLIHERIRQATAGDCVQLLPAGTTGPPGAKALLVCTPAGAPLARLSQRAAALWFPRLASIVEVRILAMVRRYSTDSQPDFQARHRCDFWEIPVLEVVTSA